MNSPGNLDVDLVPDHASADARLTVDDRYRRGGVLARGALWRPPRALLGAGGGGGALICPSPGAGRRQAPQLGALPLLEGIRGR